MLGGAALGYWEPINSEVVERVEREVVLPGLDRLAPEQRRGAGDGTRVPHDDLGLAPEAALPPGDGEHVRLKGFSPEEQILERLVEAG